MYLSSKAQKALNGLGAESRTMQRAGLVPGFRLVMGYSEDLKEELERLEKENAQFKEQIAGGRKENEQLKAEIVELREHIAELEADDGGWPVPKDMPDPLPPDYWETAQ